MCTIITVNQAFYFQSKSELMARIIGDSVSNSEGWTLVGVDTRNPDNDFKFHAMRVNQLSSLIETFFLTCTEMGRIFLHARAATTRAVGIAYTHGFDNGHGTIVMHNGIIKNTRQLAVDSFNLTDLSDEAEVLLAQLTSLGETFANIFLINPSDESYGIVRLSVGTLHSDGKGNYSTNPMGLISVPVEQNTAITHFLDSDGDISPRHFRDYYSGRLEDYSKYESDISDLDGVGPITEYFESRGWDSVDTGTFKKKKA